MSQLKLTPVFTKVLRLDKTPDPALLYGALSANGTKENTLLFESADHETHESETSLIVETAALKITCRGSLVTAQSLTENGVLALAAIKNALAEHVEEILEESVQFRFAINRLEKNMEKRLTVKSPMDVLRVITKIFALEQDVSPELFLVLGAFSYDMVDLFEDLPEAKKDELDYPDFVFWLPERYIVVHHRKNFSQIVHHRFSQAILQQDIEMEHLADLCLADEHQEELMSVLAEEPEDIGKIADISDDEYAQIVNKMKEHIVLGNVFQIVPSRTFKKECSRPLLAYRSLRKINPSPYMYYIKEKDFTLFGASPETFIKVSNEGKKVEVKPIAGTRPRGFLTNGQINKRLDLKLETELRADEKELAEHLMLVDLARNDVARVSKEKTRKVTKFLTVDRYLHVMHLVSCVEGELQSNLDALHAYQASVNMGTLVGAPKIKAAQILRETEKTKRGFYGGAVGYLNMKGELDTAIVIRSALVKNNFAYVRSGAGIVYDSVPDAEVLETKQKAKAVLMAIDAANNAGGLS